MKRFAFQLIGAFLLLAFWHLLADWIASKDGTSASRVFMDLVAATFAFHALGSVQGKPAEHSK